MSMGLRQFTVARLRIRSCCRDGPSVGPSLTVFGQLQSGIKKSAARRRTDSSRTLRNGRADRTLTWPLSDFVWQAHPHFGAMSERDWMSLSYVQPIIISGNSELRICLAHCGVAACARLPESDTLRLLRHSETAKA
jgi:hypothetical protein